MLGASAAAAIGGPARAGGLGPIRLAFVARGDSLSLLRGLLRRMNRVIEILRRLHPQFKLVNL